MRTWSARLCEVARVDAARRVSTRTTRRSRRSRRAEVWVFGFCRLVWRALCSIWFAGGIVPGTARRPARQILSTSTAPRRRRNRGWARGVVSRVGGRRRWVYRRRRRTPRATPRRRWRRASSRARARGPRRRATRGGGCSRTRGGGRRPREKRRAWTREARPTGRNPTGARSRTAARCILRGETRTSSPRVATVSRVPRHQPPRRFTGRLSN